MARAAANGLGTITNLETMEAFLKVSYGARFMVKTVENGRKKFYTSCLDHWSADTTGVLSLYNWRKQQLNTIDVSRTEDLGDDILRRAYLDFIYVHPIVLWFTCKAQ